MGALNFNKLLNNPYIDPKGLPNSQWGEVEISFDYSYSILGLLGNIITDMFHYSHICPISMPDKIINSNQSFANLVNEHAADLEFSYLNMIRLILDQSNEIVCSKKDFLQMDLSQKCLALGIESYLSDRNILDLYHYINVLTTEPGL